MTSKKTALIQPAAGDRLQSEAWQRSQGPPRSTGSDEIHYSDNPLRKASRNERLSVTDWSKTAPSPAPSLALAACVSCRMPQESASRMAKVIVFAVTMPLLQYPFPRASVRIHYGEQLNVLPAQFLCPHSLPHLLHHPDFPRIQWEDQLIANQSGNGRPASTDQRCWQGLDVFTSLAGNVGNMKCAPTPIDGRKAVLKIRCCPCLRSDPVSLALLSNRHNA